MQTGCYQIKMFTEHRFRLNFLKRVFCGFFFNENIKECLHFNIWLCVGTQTPADTLCPTYILSQPFSYWYKSGMKCRLPFWAA